MDEVDIFKERFISEWLPSFCDARPEDYCVEGVVEKSLENLNQFDVGWFLRAVSMGLVTENDGFFVAPMSRAKETIMHGTKGDANRKKIFLWMEPIITIGACARLVEEFGWPIERVGMQSEYPWPFDLVCYNDEKGGELVACEVKKQNGEIEKLLGHMQSFCKIGALKQEPENPIEKNSYRKVVGIRKSWPKLFWALGPSGYSRLFKIEANLDTEQFEMSPVDEALLHYSHFA